MATILKANVWCLSCVYRVPPVVTDLRRRARNDLLVTNKEQAAALGGRRGVIPFARPPSDLVSFVRGAIAFGLSVTADLVSAVLDRSKMAQWWEALVEFNAFLVASGVGNELQEAITKPLWSGRLLDNMKILNDIQEVMYVDRPRKIATIPDVRDALHEGTR